MSEAQMPPHIAKRLEQESERFGKTPAQAAEHEAEVAARRASIEARIAAQGHSQVEHAKAVAAENRAGNPEVAQAVQDEQAEVARRHEAILAEKSRAAGAEVQHAKEVAAAHSGTTDLESSVEHKKLHVQENQAELQKLEQSLQEASRREAELKAKLGVS